MDYTEIDRRANELLREELLGSQGYDATQRRVWSALMSEFPDVHSNIIAERVAAAMWVDGGRRSMEAAR